jgi:hypothetical protein
MDKKVWKTYKVDEETELLWMADNDPKGKNSTIILKLLLPPNVTRGKELIVDIKHNHLKIAYNISKVSPPEIVIDKKLRRLVISEESTWVIEEEGRRKYLSIHLAKKVDGENWSVLFADEQDEEEEKKKNNAVTAKNSSQLTQKQRDAREKSDQLVLQNLISKMGPEAKVEIEGLLAKGISAGDVLKIVNNSRRGQQTEIRR